MTTSLPSNEICAIDIPEVDNFSANFQYNFFTKDESTEDTGGVPEQFLQKPSGEIDADFIQLASTKSPRFVLINFTYPKLADAGNELTSADVRSNIFGKNTTSNYIASNFDKIITEDQFSSHNFIAVNFHDSEIQDKIFFLVSGSVESRKITGHLPLDISPPKLGHSLRHTVPRSVTQNFLNKAASNKSRSSGMNFFKTTRNNGASRTGSDGTSFNRPKGKWKDSISPSGRSYAGESRLNLDDSFFTRLQNVNINTQINSKLFVDLISKNIQDPNSQHGNDLHYLSRLGKRISDTKKSENKGLAEIDYKTIIPYVDYCMKKTVFQPIRQPSEIIGYVIDKSEITSNGNLITHSPIIVENEKTTSTLDFKVKYGSRYRYSIKTIAKLTIPAIDNESGDVAAITVLVSSKPSSPIYVKCIETDAPPPPADLNFVWDYEKQNLVFHWNFPVNSQRDIKKFQIFRRRSIDESFQLLKMYDFDDSYVKFKNLETPDPSLVEFVSNPVNYFIDDDFNKTSKYIYCLASIDAHGFTSNYSAQFELSFDLFKNKLVKKLISHSGAPKSYPNLYLETDMFVDTMRVAGANSKKMKIYFNPEYYGLTNDNEEFIETFSTKQQKGCFKLQAINLDNQKSSLITITIDDQIKNKPSNQVSKVYLKQEMNRRRDGEKEQRL